MRKVCHMTSAHPSEDVRIFHKECTSLAKAGYDVYLVTRGESYEKNGVHIVGVGYPSGGRLNRMTTFSRKIYKAALAIDADIYQFHDPELLPYGLKLKKNGKKIIFDSHEQYAAQLKNKPYLPHWCCLMLAAIYKVYESCVLRKLDGVIFPCTINGRNPFQSCCPQVATISNAPMLDEMYDQYDSSVIKWPRSVCHIGSLTHNRGITHLVKAAALADCTLYLGGLFESAEYEAQIRVMPEFANVKYLGKLDRNAVVETLQKSQIGAATLLDVGQYYQIETFATKVYEQMSFGLPSVLNASQYNQKVAQQYGMGICVDPENAGEIAEAIRYLLDHPEEAKQMGENGRRAVKEEFNWDVEEKKLLSFYEKILKEKGNGA